MILKIKYKLQFNSSNRIIRNNGKRQQLFTLLDIEMFLKDGNQRFI